MNASARANTSTRASASAGATALPLAVPTETRAGELCQSRRAAIAAVLALRGLLDESGPPSAG